MLDQAGALRRQRSDARSRVFEIAVHAGFRGRALGGAPRGAATRGAATRGAFLETSVKVPSHLWQACLYRASRPQSFWKWQSRPVAALLPNEVHCILVLK